MSGRLIFGLLVTLALLPTACDHGLEPPESVPFGSITGVITYSGSWPPADQVRDLRFVAMRFVPKDTVDFLQLNRMAISARLAYGVARDTFRIDGVEPGAFFYSGIAQQQTTDILSWRPIGLLDGDGGFFSLEGGQTVDLQLTVDFSQVPDFPPRR